MLQSTRTADLRWSALAVALFLPGCGTDDHQASAPAIVGAGWYSGLCSGGCRGTLEIAESSLAYTLYDTFADDSEVISVHRAALADAAATELTALAADMPEGQTYGCPGCADGLVGLINLVDSRGEQSEHKYQFFPDDIPPELRPAHELLYLLMKDMEACASANTHTIQQPCPVQ